METTHRFICIEHCVEPDSLTIEIIIYFMLLIINVHHIQVDVRVRRT